MESGLTLIILRFLDNKLPNTVNYAAVFFQQFFK